ncbi:DUF1330 domain-containing protein [Streptomyces hoynatensis]|uniref:DUF1330 domain-containing protein n=1 Tax=Streptomyces hoynatensis TaxID=1141874 RepID=A0A3A9ZFP4_9ACTN|nr:DUF1330 domain-containing protein [Streptomyces hoynatensis]RKN47272.1 DUF1330 domain-containing protein [Streptomyces hoynatensis]
MAAYALARLRVRREHPDIADYIELIQPTLDPFGGRFLIHGGRSEVVEGQWEGDTVLLEFPGMKEARGWYESEEYREILPLRTRHIEGDVILVDGVPPHYDPRTTAAAMREKPGRS